MKRNFFFIESILNFIYPHFCSWCGQSEPFGKVICTACFEKIKWYDHTCLCKRCCNAIDPEDLYCLNCKKGYFYPDQVWIVFEKFFPLTPLSKKKVELTTDLLTIFFLEHQLDQKIDSFAFFSSKRLTSHPLIERFSQKVQVPQSNKKLIKGHLLLIGETLTHPAALNPITLTFLKRGFDAVSFLYLTDQRIH